MSTPTASNFHDHPEVMTVKESAALLRISTKTVYALVKAGRLGAYRAGRALRIRRSTVLQLLDGAPLNP
jgi:excisionase family DNA binding protein